MTSALGADNAKTGAGCDSVGARFFDASLTTRLVSD
jgi:hypothetical protein